MAPLPVHSPTPPPDAAKQMSHNDEIEAVAIKDETQREGLSLPGQCGARPSALGGRAVSCRAANCRARCPCSVDRTPLTLVVVV